MISDAFQAVRRKENKLGQILEALPDINVKDIGGQNLLHEAAACGNLEAAVELIQRGINVNAPDKNGQTPLHFAGLHSRANIARAILASGGDISIRDTYGNTPLWSAVFNARGDYETVDVILEFRGGKVAEMKNNHGRSPLDFAKQIGDAKLVSALSLN